MGGILNNILFRRTKAGDPVRRVADTENLNFVYSVLESIEGVGCHIEKPIGAGGEGWRLVMDGKLSDQKPVTPLDLRPLSGDADAGNPKTESVHWDSGDGDTSDAEKCFRLYDFLDVSGPGLFFPGRMSFALRHKADGQLGVNEIAALSGEPVNTDESGNAIRPRGPETVRYIPPAQLMSAYFPADSDAFCMSGFQYCAADTRSMTLCGGSNLTLNMERISALEQYDQLLVKRGGEVHYKQTSCPEEELDDKIEETAIGYLSMLVDEYVSSCGVEKPSGGPPGDGIYIFSAGQDEDFPDAPWKWVLWCKWEDWTESGAEDYDGLVQQMAYLSQQASTLWSAWSGGESSRSAAICGLAILKPAHEAWLSALVDAPTVTSGFESLSASASGAIITVSGLEDALSAFDEWGEEAGDRISALENRS